MNNLVRLVFRIAACSGLAGTLSGAGEVLLHEDFEKFDLAKLPPKCATSESPSLSITSDPDKGKVLQIDAKGNVTPALSFDLDTAKAAGHKLHVSVFGRCPGKYTKNKEKFEFPQLMLEYRTAAGASNMVFIGVDPESKAWTELKMDVDVPADSNSVTVTLRVHNVQAQVFFDTLHVEASGAAAPAAPPAQNPFAPDRSASTSTPSEPPLLTPMGLAAMAPTRELDTESILFEPQIAANMHAALKPGATAHTYAVIGPGAPLKDLPPTALKSWKQIPAAKDIVGAAATNDALLSALPKFVAAAKPEIVLIVQSAADAHKPSRDERFDWEDIARLCARLNAVPVVAVSPAGTQDALRKELLEGAHRARCPVLDLKEPELIPKHTGQLFRLIETYVFERKAPAPNAGGAEGDE